jgi:UPF0271 protein
MEWYMQTEMQTERKINLNADLGESFGPWTMGEDAAMLDIVTSANIACGFHAGDPDVMRRTVADAVARGVSLGAHPGYADLQGFGRRALKMTAAEIENLVACQVGALTGVARLAGGRVTHVKPHGALNNQACVDQGIADAICRAVHAVDPDLILLAPAASALLAAGQAAGLVTVVEIFADRAYLDDGQLMPRNQPGAVLYDASACAARILAMLAAGALIAASGKQIPTEIGSICVHGDGQDAVALARALRQALETAGWRIATLPQLVPKM